ncbi:MAG: T9SS type A sorting domain-containing protein [Haliscomenobacter sp.]
MKQIILLFFLFFGSYIASAQVLQIEPGEVKQTFRVNLSDPFINLELVATVRNMGKDTLKLKWVRKEIDKPSEWQTQVCDGVECYIPLVSSNIDPQLGLNAPFVLPPNGKADFIFHLIPTQTAGTGKFAVDFFSMQKPDSLLARMNFEATVQNLTTSVKDRQLETAQVFPNPAIDYFMLNAIDGIDRMVLYNALGVPVRTYLPAYGQRYSLNNLPDGMYLLTLANTGKGVLKTLRIVKRSIRS